MMKPKLPQLGVDHTRLIGAFIDGINAAHWREEWKQRAKS
jgi:hypothetical protein